MRTAEKTQTAEHAPAYTIPKLRVLFSGSLGPLQSPQISLTAGSGGLPIGRSVTRGMSLATDHFASALHAHLDLEANGQVKLRDRESRHGSFVNGQRIREAVLADGDLLRFGDTLVLLRYEPTTLPDGEIPELVGRAQGLRLVRNRIGIIGDSHVRVLIHGESGTGKELAAAALHRLSGRTAGELVVVNCSTLTTELADSQLFGHRTGAFTGARDHHSGFFSLAHRGTLFLDEVGELPEPVQAKFLRVLEDHQVRPLGAQAAHEVDVRIIAATNRDLWAEVTNRRFRGDLYTRLTEAELHIPPLRDRREDILTLLQVGFARAQRRDGARPQPELSADFAEALLLHPWPFNVRQLFNVATQLYLGTASQREVMTELRLRGEATHHAPPPQVKNEDEDGVPESAWNIGKLESLLRKHRGNTTDVALELDVSRYKLRRIFAQLGITPVRFKRVPTQQ